MSHFHMIVTINVSKTYSQFTMKESTNAAQKFATHQYAALSVLYLPYHIL